MVGRGFEAGGEFSARRTISFNALVTTPARVTRSRREVVSKFFCEDFASINVEPYSLRCWWMVSRTDFAFAADSLRGLDEGGVSSLGPTDDDRGEI